MAETTAVEQHTCPACGAKAEWQPSSQTLACGYCGTVAPYEVDAASGKIREIDLVKTLREMPEQLRGWQAERRSVRCRSCKAVSVFDPGRVGQNCDFCGSPELVDYDEINAPIRPQSLLPFRIDEAKVRESMRRWYAGRWFAPNRLKQRAMVDTVHGLYIPYWTFDAQVVCPWTAQSGTYYYTAESYRQGGKTRTRQVRHVRWRPASGCVEHSFDDQAVPGTQGVDSRLLQSIEPFPTGDLLPYDTAYLSGFVVEHYQVVLIDAARQARESMESQLHRLCAAQVPGDTHRALRIDPDYSGETFKHILVPIWLLSYRYGSRSFQLVANGYTGAMAGRYPKSPWKIFFLVVFVLLLVALFFLLDAANVF